MHEETERSGLAPRDAATAAREHASAHWFRRAVHAFGAAFIVYYLIPDAGAWGVVKQLGPPLVVAAVLGVEVARVAGWIRDEHVFGLREYERNRIGAYAYFGVAALVLLLFVPQALAVPCLVGMALLDPLHGELRARGSPRAAILAGFLLATLLFLVAGWGWEWAVLGGSLMVLGEVVPSRHVDDDLLMGLLPAVGLGAAAWLGWVVVPEPFLAPFTGVP